MHCRRGRISAGDKLYNSNNNKLRRKPVNTGSNYSYVEVVLIFEQTHGEWNGGGGGKRHLHTDRVHIFIYIHFKKIFC
jgi:hypothetical protein